ncbi:MAG: tetratricopeptide repeat protein [Steroidobacteraceae bacterium]
MITFVLLAAVLTVAGVALVAVPLLKKRPVEYSPAPWAALLAAGVLAIGSTVLYVRWTNWSWHTTASEDTPQTMVARLARRLEKNPEDLNGWLTLGRSYSVLQEYQLALRAFQRADRLAGGRNADALIGQAEALALSDESELDRRAGRLIEQALALDPQSGKALFFGAAAAMRRGELPLARERFAKLLSLNPPDNIKPLLQKQIDAIDQRLAGGPAQDASARPAGQPQVAAASDSSAKVRINVMLAPNLAQSASGSPLFVFVRDPQRPGPPLAVKRLDSRFPQAVELTAADSMLPGRAIAAGQKVQVVARISRSGNPVGASGDLFGESAYTVGRDDLINILIDKVTP